MGERTHKGFDGIAPAVLVGEGAVWGDHGRLELSLAGWLAWAAKKAARRNKAYHQGREVWFSSVLWNGEVYEIEIKQ